MVYWFGSVSGCAARPREHKVEVPNAEPAAQVSIERSPRISENPRTPEDRVAEAAQELWAGQEVSAEISRHEHLSSDPSLGQGLSRTHWEKITVGPVDGRTHHFPVYFSDLVIDRGSAGHGSGGELGMGLHDAMDGARAGRWDRRNTAAFFVQPAKLLIDGVYLIVRQVRDPFWESTTTPPRIP